MRIIDWFIVIIGVSGLIGIRVLEDRLFYDPFLQYFHEANKNALFPEFEWGKLIGNYLYRFGLNLFFSGVIIHFIFKKIRWTLQGLLMIVLVFILSFSLYLYCIFSHFEIGYLFSFYMRRFVIQPIILLLIIPLFYYRQHLLEKENFT